MNSAAERAGRGGRSATLLLASVVLTAIAIVVPVDAARAASPEEVAALGAQPCPDYRVMKSRAHTPTEVARAKQGSFDVMAGYPAQLEAPVDWGQDPYANQSWVDYLHAFAWTDPLLYAYVTDGDLAALADARDLILDWLAANPRDGAGTPARAWLDKTSGDRAGYLGFIAVAAACEDLLSDEQSATLIDAIRDHAGLLASPELYAANNHGLFVDLGLALLGYYGSFLPEADGWVTQARERFDRTLHGRLAERDAIWLENSNEYQFLAIRLLERFSTAIAEQPYAMVLERMREAAGWLITPEGKQAPTGDSRSNTPLPDWALEQAADDSGMRVMWDAGLAVIKRRGGFLQITAGFHNRTHKHADDLGFHLYDRGRDVISDSGVYHYDPDDWRRYSLSPDAHSVLTVDGERFPISEPQNAYGSGIVAAGKGDGWYAIEGRNPLLRDQGVGHRRVFLYRPGRALLLIDRVRSTSRHVYRRNLQLAPGLRARRARGGVALRGAGFRGMLRNRGDEARLHRAKGEFDPPRGWSFPGFRERVPRWTLSYRARARNARYLTAIGLHGAVDARVRAARGRSLRIELGGPSIRDGELRLRRIGSRLSINVRARP